MLHPNRNHSILDQCPVCDGGHHDLWQEKNDYAIVRCRDCNFVFSRDYPNFDFLSRRYSKSYSKDAENFTPKGGIGRSLKYRILTRWLQKFFPEKESPIRLLEIGCGQGDLLKSVHNNPRFAAQGLDYGKRRVQYAREIGLDAREGDIESQGFADNTFDLVVALHVIEHVHDLHSTIAEIRRVLKPGGLFFAVCPCVTHFKARLAGERWKYLGPPGHLWYFSPRTFSRLVRRIGFETLSTSCFYHRAHVRILAKKTDAPQPGSRQPASPPDRHSSIPDLGLEKK